MRIPGVFSENYWHNKKTSKGEPGECNFGEIHSSLISAISPLWERERGRTERNGVKQQKEARDFQFIIRSFSKVTVIQRWDEG